MSSRFLGAPLGLHKLKNSAMEGWDIINFKVLGVLPNDMFL